MIDFGTVVMCDPEPEIVRFEQHFMDVKKIRGVATSRGEDVLHLVELARRGGRQYRVAVVDLDAHLESGELLACELLDQVPQLALVVTGALPEGFAEVARHSARRVVYLQKPFNSSELVAAMLEAS